MGGLRGLFPLFPLGVVLLLSLGCREFTFQE